MLYTKKKKNNIVYKETEEQLYQQAIKLQTPLKEAFVLFKDFTGQYSPGGKMIRDMLEYTSYSDLNCTGKKDC